MLREAIDYAINESEIRSDLFYVPNPPSLEAAVQSFDPERAVEALAEAGFPDGFTDLCITSLIVNGDIATSIISHLAEVGIEALQVETRTQRSCEAGLLIITDFEE